MAVSGGSYGGGESWLQASQADWTYPHSVLPALPVLHLRVAVPKYPWTDLAYSLAPNGHGGGPGGGDLYESSQGQPTSGVGNPIGVVKQSYAGALSAKGSATGTFEMGTTTTPSSEGPINIAAWFARLVSIGDPYELPNGQDSDPIVAQVRRGLTDYRGAYYQLPDWQAQVGHREVAVFSSPAGQTTCTRRWSPSASSKSSFGWTRTGLSRSELPTSGIRARRTGPKTGSC